MSRSVSTRSLSWETSLKSALSPSRTHGRPDCPACSRRSLCPDPCGRGFLLLLLIFPTTGITAYLENGGILEYAQAIAAHESPSTAKLYDRTSDQITLDEVERIQI